MEGFSTGGTWYVGRPLIVTQNDYGLDLYNGDTGVVIEPRAAGWWPPSSGGGSVAEVSPTRLAAVDTVYAMTVHKSQGSQFETVAFLVPGPDSRVLTRELLYTAVTRARNGSSSSAPSCRSGPPWSVRSPGPPGCATPSGAGRPDSGAGRPRFHPPAAVARCLGCGAGENPWSHGIYSHPTAKIQGPAP